MNADNAFPDTNGLILSGPMKSPSARVPVKLTCTAPAGAAEPLETFKVSSLTSSRLKCGPTALNSIVMLLIDSA